MKIDVDALLDLLITYEGQIEGLEISKDKIKLLKSDGSTETFSLKKVQKVVVKFKPGANVTNPYNNMPRRRLKK
jgi:hypothetical protein